MINLSHFKKIMNKKYNVYLELKEKIQLIIK